MDYKASPIDGKEKGESRAMVKERALKLRRMVKRLDPDPPRHAAPHVPAPAEDVFADDETLILGQTSPVSTLSWGSDWETEPQYHASEMAAAERAKACVAEQLPPVPQFSPLIWSRA